VDKLKIYDVLRDSNYPEYKNLLPSNLDLFDLTYTDEEGDIVTLTDAADFIDAVKFFQSEKKIPSFSVSIRASLEESPGTVNGYEGVVGMRSENTEAGVGLSNGTEGQTSSEPMHDDDFASGLSLLASAQGNSWGKEASNNFPSFSSSAFTAPSMRQGSYSGMLNGGAQSSRVLNQKHHGQRHQPSNLGLSNLLGLSSGGVTSQNDTPPLPSLALAFDSMESKNNSNGNNIGVSVPGLASAMSDDSPPPGFSVDQIASSSISKADVGQNSSMMQNFQINNAVHQAVNSRHQPFSSRTQRVGSVDDLAPRNAPITINSRREVSRDRAANQASSMRSASSMNIGGGSSSAHNSPGKVSRNGHDNSNASTKSASTAMGAVSWKSIAASAGTKSTGKKIVTSTKAPAAGSSMSRKVMNHLGDGQLSSYLSPIYPDTLFTETDNLKAIQQHQRQGLNPAIVKHLFKGAATDDRRQERQGGQHPTIDDPKNAKLILLGRDGDAATGKFWMLKSDGVAIYLVDPRENYHVLVKSPRGGYIRVRHEEFEYRYNFEFVPHPKLKSHTKGGRFFVKYRRNDNIRQYVRF
jgi:hypothetical protein